MTVQTFLRAAQGAGLAHNSGAGGEFILVGTAAQLESLELALQGDGGYVPGIMRCDRCRFELTRVTLNVNVGTATAGNSEPEPCPNGCGPLRPTTWKERATDGEKALETWCDRAIAAEKALTITAPPLVEARSLSDFPDLQEALRRDTEAGTARVSGAATHPKEPTEARGDGVPAFNPDKHNETTYPHFAVLHAGDGRRSGPITASCDNVLAWRMGQAHAAAANASAGDYIDRGLVLLRELRARGLRVIQETDAGVKEKD